MIVYLVELDVPIALRDEYMAWLAGHVDEMLGLPGFIDAEIATRLDPPPASGRFAACVRYRLHNPAAWDTYLRDHAPRMRAAGLARFGDRVQARRQLLETV